MKAIFDERFGDGRKGRKKIFDGRNIQEVHAVLVNF